MEFLTSQPKIFKGLAKQWRVTPQSANPDYTDELVSFKKYIEGEIQKQREEKKEKGIKVHISCKASFDVVKEGVLVDQPSYHFTAKSATILPSDLVEEETDHIFWRLQERIQDRKDRGSGFQFKAIQSFDVTTATFQPVVGGNWIKSPKWLIARRAVLNIESRDDECLLNCIVAHQHPVPSKKNPQRPSHYRRYHSEINVEGVNFPAGRKDLDRIEMLNPQLSLNVFTIEPQEKAKGQKRQKIVVHPYRISKNRGEGKVPIDLLLMEEETSTKRHYALIKDLGRLTRQACRKHNAMSYVCRYCVQHFTRQDLLDTHLELCEKQKPAALKFPTKGKDDFVQFRNYERMLEKEYYIICDWETKEKVNQNVQGLDEEGLSQEEKNEKPFPWIKNKKELSHAMKCKVCLMTKPCSKIKQSTTKLAHLEPFSFSYQVVGENGKFRLYQEEDCLEQFLINLKEDSRWIYHQLQRNNPILMNAEDHKRHEEATVCFICHEGFTEKNHKVAHHHHRQNTQADSNYIAPLCNECNLKHRTQRSVDILTHNLSKFDAHLVMDAIGQDVVHVKKVENMIAKTMEQYVSFDLYLRCDACIVAGKSAKCDEGDPPEDCYCKELLPLRFKDSFKFLSASLDKLVQNLKTKCFTIDCGDCNKEPCTKCKDKEDPKVVFPHTFQYVEDHYGKEWFEILNRKLPYPYSYVDSYERLDEKELPPKEAFYNKLLQEHISDKDYALVKKIWTELELDMRGLAELYLRWDVLNLADVFEDFRRMSLREDKLDPLHYLTLPSLSLDSALLKTGVRLELITDPTLSLWFSEMMRGGIVFTALRHFKANNPECPDDYNPGAPSQYLMYWDANNL